MKSTLGAGSFIRQKSTMLTRLHKYAQPLAFHPSRLSSPFRNEIEKVHDYGFKRNYRYTGYRLGSIPQGGFSYLAFPRISRFSGSLPCVGRGLY